MSHPFFSVKKIYSFSLALCLSSTATLAFAEVGASDPSDSNTPISVTARPAKAAPSLKTKAKAKIKRKRRVKRKTGLSYYEILAQEKLADSSSVESNKALPIELIFNEDIKNFDNKAKLAFLFSAIDMNTALRARAVEPSAYEGPVYKNNPNAKYVPTDVRDKLINSKACDLEANGACVVLEKISNGQKSVTRGYYLASAPSLKPHLKAFNYHEIGRQEVSAKLLPRKDAIAKELLEGKTDGIYIYSLAPSEKTALANSEQLDINTNETIANTTEQPVKPSGFKYGSNSLYIVSKGDKYDVPQDKVAEFDKTYSQNLKENFAVIDTLSAKSNNGLPDPLGSSEYAFSQANNLHSPTMFTSDEVNRMRNAIRENRVAEASLSGQEALFNNCFIIADLKLVRRFAILDTFLLNPDAKDKPTKSGKGALYCYLKDGRRQQVNIVIKDYHYNRIGLALSNVTEHFFSWGIGWANGVLDILLQKDFGYIVQKDAQGLIGGISFTPIIFSLDPNKKPIFAFGIAGVLEPMLLNLNVTIGGKYEIEVDPDDT